MLRYKTFIGRCLYARALTNRWSAAKIGCKVLNRMTKFSMPVSAQIKYSEKLREK